MRGPIDGASAGWVTVELLSLLRRCASLRGLEQLGSSGGGRGWQAADVRPIGARLRAGSEPEDGVRTRTWYGASSFSSDDSRLS